TDSEIAAVDSRSNLTDRVINNATNPEYLPEEFKPMTAELGVGEAVYKGSLSNGRWFPTHSGNFSFNVNMNSGLVTNFSANIERNGGSRGSLEVRQSGVMSIDNNGVFQSNPGDLEFRSESGRWGNSYSGANETNSSLRGEIGRRPDLDLDIRNNSNHSIVDLDGRGISCQGDCRR
ncbi:MAG: hypothetical protein LBV04_01540, partial [Deferribacteraceae bacterium]|nr:hypothetical protein [Deferribacteraceae bacterium]